MALTKVPSNLDATVATTQSASDNSTNIATTAYVTTAIANLVDGAPSTLNTLDEIAAALNDDAALNTTLTNSIATKLPLAGGTMTGTLGITGAISSGADTTIASFGRAGSAVSSSIIYADATTDMEFGTTTAHALSLITGDTRRLTIDSSGNATFTGAITSTSSIEAASGANLIQLGTDGNIEITRTAGGAYIDFKDSTSEDYDQRIQATSTGHNFSGTIASGAITSTGNITTDYNDTIAMSYAPGPTDYYKGMTGTSFNGAATARGLHLFNFDNDSNLGINFWVGTSASKQLAAIIDSSGDLNMVRASSHSSINYTTDGSLDYARITGGKYGSGVGDLRLFTYSGGLGERMRITNVGNVDIGKASFSSYPAGSKLNVYADGEGIRLDGTGNTTRRIRFRNVGAGSGPGEIVADGSLVIKNEDANAYLNLSSVRNIEYQVTSGNGTAGHHIFSSYNTEIMRLDGASNNAKFTYPILQGGSTTSVGIGSTMQDVNGAELGPGYLSLARDDTADAKQISFSKNGVRVSDISTTDKGILWEVLESSGNAAAFQVTNGVGHTVWGSMNAQGHKWQDNVYNAFSVGGMSIGTDSSNTSHMWWNTYDTGTKHGVSSGYGMDEYVSNSNGDYVIRMSDNSSFVGDGVTLTQRYKFENAGALNIYGSGSVHSSNDGHLYIEKNNSNDWFIKLLSGSDDYGMFVRGNGSYALAIFNQPSNAYRARFNYDGQLYLNGGSSAVYNINSDERLKEDITDCPSQWDLIKGLPLQRFHWKDRREGDKWSYGFIAQEVEKTNPEFVELVPQEKDSFENGEEDPKYKTVAEGQIHERALAALQEAMARIEILEAEVASLKG